MCTHLLMKQFVGIAYCVTHLLITVVVLLNKHSLEWNGNKNVDDTMARAGLL